MKRESRAPLMIAIVLLLLPVLYVGSYFVLVVPGGRQVFETRQNGSFVEGYGMFYHYRINAEWPESFFWPLEQIDRKLRPSAWGLRLQKLGKSLRPLPAPAPPLPFKKHSD